jgi:hypothetical protein
VIALEAPAGKRCEISASAEDVHGNLETSPHRISVE